MPDLLTLDREDVERLLEVEPLLEALEAALVAIADGEVSAPPRIAARAPDGLVGTMPGRIPGTLAVKVVSVFPGNEELELASHQGVVLLFDEETGEPRALMDAERIT
ncbi:MAG: ornithine cyclodeaminase family protein, partial [Gemmatimonadota bacterium]